MKKLKLGLKKVKKLGSNKEINKNDRILATIKLLIELLIYTCSFGVNKTATPMLPAIEITPKIVFINPLIIKTRPRINAIEIKQKSIEENIHHSQK